MSNPTGLNINDLKQLSQLMSNDQPIQPALPKVIKKVKIQSPPVSDGSDATPHQHSKLPDKTQQTLPHQQHQQPQQPQQTQQTIESSPNFELMGYVVNKQTIYLLIVLILIGVGIWFMTTEKSPKKGKKKEEKKEEKDEDDDGNNDYNNE